MKVGIVILNWNGQQLLERFLPPLIEFSKGHHIYVADNASTDSSISYVQQFFPQVSIIKLASNKGFAGGYNDALKQVEENVYCLLNNDVEVTPGWCDVVSDQFTKNPDVAVLQPKIKDLNNKTFFEYAGAAGGFIDRYAYPYCRGRIFNVIEEDHGQYNDPLDVHWASGACLFIRKEVFIEVGGMDESYFAHQEEIDLCWRIRHLGYRVSIVTMAEVFHLGGGTLQHSNPRKTFYNFRNSLFNIVKNDFSKNWVLILLTRMILDGIAAVKFLFEFKPSHFVAVLKAHFDFYLNLKSKIKARQVFKLKCGDNEVSNSHLSIVYQHFVNNIRFYTSL
jgi:hypothetical protein